MNSKIVSSTKISSIILAIVLVVGTITSIIFPSSSSFMAGIGITAQAERDYDGHDNKDDDRKSYGKDNNNNIYKSQKSSKSVDVKKINCNNINVNVNGIELNVTSFPFLSRIAADAVDTSEDNYGAASYENGGSYDGHADKNKDDFAFVCINNNNNIGAGDNVTPPTPPPIGNNVYVVWQDDTSGNNDIFFRVSNDNGQTFNPVINLSNNVGDSVNPRMVVSGNNVYVVWEDDRDIFFRASDDNGQTFNPVIELSNNVGDSGGPQMLVSGNNVYIAWADEESSNGEFTILFRVSNDNGQTFNPVIDLSKNHDIAGFSMLISGNNVYVVFVDLGTIGDDVYFRVSTDNGQTFDPIINLSNNAGISASQRMTISDDNVYVTWEDTSNGGDTDIFFRASDDNGETFDSIIDLSNNSGASIRPQISSSAS